MRSLINSSLSGNLAHILPGSQARWGCSENIRWKTVVPVLPAPTMIIGPLLSMTNSPQPLEQNFCISQRLAPYHNRWMLWVPALETLRKDSSSHAPTLALLPTRNRLPSTIISSLEVTICAGSRQYLQRHPAEVATTPDV